MSDNPSQEKAHSVLKKAVPPAPEVYKYYSTQRPVDIGTFPKTENGPVEIVNFDKRENVENGRFQAWGYLLYHASLTDKQIENYELRSAPSNSDQLQLAPESKARSEKKSIAERIKEGTEQAARNNAAHPAPAKNTEKSR